MAFHWRADFCLLQMEDARLWECVAPMTVFLPMQVAPGGLGGWEWTSLTRGEEGNMGWWRLHCNHHLLCTWAHSVMKWPVSWRPYLNNGPIQLREQTVRTGLNTIPLIQGYSHSFLSILVFYTLLTVEITSSHLSLCLHAEKKCVRDLYKDLETKNILKGTFLKRYHCHCLPLCEDHLCCQETHFQVVLASLCHCILMPLLLLAHWDKHWFNVV